MKNENKQKKKKLYIFSLNIIILLFADLSFMVLCMEKQQKRTNKFNSLKELHPTNLIFFSDVWDYTLTDTHQR